MMTQMEAQGWTGDDLRSRASEVLAHLTEEQLLIVLAYARSLQRQPRALKDHVLEDLVEDFH
jgi:hypothetical protein